MIGIIRLEHGGTAVKKLGLLIAVLLLLTACGAQETGVAVKEPYSLEIEYGDSGVDAAMMNYEWHTADHDLFSEELDPMTFLSDLPFVNESKDKRLKLLFDVEPDTLEIRYWTSADGYGEAVTVEKPKLKLDAPEDGCSYLYEVKAVWEQTEKALSWGSSYYYFRFLPEGSTGEQYQEMSLYRLVQLRPADLFGVEFFNNLDGQQKTCTSSTDREAILDYLKEHLTTNFVQIEMPEEEADYVLRLAVTDGTQLTLGYGGEGQGAWLLFGGVPYEVEVMDLYSLWESLEAETIQLDDGSLDQYLQVSEEFPGTAWGEEFTYAYLRSLDTEVLYDEILWIEDADQPNGYDLQRGTLGLSLPLAENCEYWILDNHAQPWCQVEQETLWQWAETAGWDVLFRLYTIGGEIVAICEQYVP